MAEKLANETLSHIFSIACHTSEHQLRLSFETENGSRLRDEFKLTRFILHPHTLKGCGRDLLLVNRRWNAIVESDSRLWKTVCYWPVHLYVPSPDPYWDVPSKHIRYVSSIKDAVLRHGASDIDIYLESPRLPFLWDILAPLSNRWRDLWAYLRSPDNLSSNFLPPSLDLRYSRLETLRMSVYTRTRAEAVQSTLFAMASPDNPVLFPRLQKVTNLGDPILFSSLLSWFSLDAITVLDIHATITLSGYLLEKEIADEILKAPIQFPNLDELRLRFFNYRTARFLSALVTPKLRLLDIIELQVVSWDGNIPDIISFPSLREFRLSARFPPAEPNIHTMIEIILSRLDVPNLETVHLALLTVLFGIRISQDPRVDKFFQNVKKFTFIIADESGSPHNAGHDAQAIFQKLVNIEDITLDFPPSRQKPIFQSLYGNAVEVQGIPPNVKKVQLPAPELAKWKTLRIGGSSMTSTQFETLVKALKYRRGTFNWKLERLEMIAGRMTKTQRRKLLELVDVVIDNANRD